MTVRIAKVDAVILQDPKFSYFQFDGSFQNVVGLVHGDSLVSIGKCDRTSPHGYLGG
jgi:hypothetical protein